MHQPPRLILPAGFQQAHGQQTGRLQADEYRHLNVGRSFPGFDEYGAGFGVAAKPGKYGAERDPGDDVTLQSRIGLQADRPLGLCQHRGRIGARPRVVGGPQDCGRGLQAAPSLIRRIVVSQARLGSVEQSREALQLTALPGRTGHADREPGIRAYDHLTQLVAEAQIGSGPALLEEGVLSWQQHLRAARRRSPAASSRRTASSTWPAVKYQSAARRSSSGTAPGEVAFSSRVNTSRKSRWYRYHSR